MANRERWSSRLVFILAAVGSAAGLGNLWRFPYLSYKYGGGAFLLPYFIALIFTGVPLLMLEFALGQKFQKGAVGSFEKINKKFSFVGWSALLTGFVVIAYYAVVMAWSLFYFFVSYGVKWAGDPENYFYHSVLGLSESINTIGGINIPLLLALVGVWLMIYFSIWKGTKSVGKVVMVTMPLPIILLVVLLGRAFTLPGALSGLKYFLVPNFRALLDTEVWLAAFSQIFFTLSIGFGVMIAYASYNEKHDIRKNAWHVALLNTFVSILSGFVVFGTLGYMALKQGVGVDAVIKSGPGLAFVVFPKAISLMPLPGLIGILFFLILISLAIDSAFSMVEGITTVILDKRPNYKREKVTAVVSAVGFLAGIIFVTGAGLYYLDVVDHFVTSYALVIVGLIECIAIGWFYGTKKLLKYIESTAKKTSWITKATWSFSIKYFTPAVLLWILGSQFMKEVRAPYEGYPLWALAVGWSIVVLIFILSFFLPKDGSE